MWNVDSGAERRPGCLHYVAFGLAALWVIFTSFALHGVAWFLAQLMLIQGSQPPSYFWPLITWVHAAALALAVVPLALFAAPPRLQAAYRAWATALVFLVVLGFSRFFPLTWSQPATAVQLALAWAGTLALAAYVRSKGHRLTRARSGVSLALAAAAFAILPWLACGALGSPLDTLLAVLAGLAFGLFAGFLLDFWLISRQPGRDVLFDGFAAGVALLVLASGFGFDGSQLLLMIALPALGFAAVLLGRRGLAETGERRGGWTAPAVLLGVAAAAPLALFDADELTLLLGLPGEGETLTWALLAAALAALVGWLVGLALPPLSALAGRRAPDVLAAGGPLAAWGLALFVYLVVGQPGFYGERLFVILREQADVAAARGISDRAERVGYVYETLVDRARASQADLRRTLDALRVSYRPYYLVNALEVDGGPFLRFYLASRSEVDRVLDSPHLRPLPVERPIATGEAPSPSEVPWNIATLGADRVWAEFGVTGKGIVVGQSDSGVQGDHPALRDGYRGREGGDDYNWLDPWNHTPRPTDVSGHGTHTLGSALGRGGIGVAPEAEWFACVNLGRNLGNPSFYIDCMQFMLAPYPQGGDPFTDGDPRRAAHVVNNSWACPPLEGCDADSLRPAVDALRAGGIFVVASAGNEGPACGSVSDPIAIYDGSLTVGAVDAAGDVAPFSSRGPVTVDGSGRAKPDLLAPGVDVLSAFPGGTYTALAGTSMAGPHVAGVVALLWSARPDLIGDVERTEQILFATASPYTGVLEDCHSGGVPNNVYGYGVVDAHAAVRKALEEP